MSTQTYMNGYAIKELLISKRSPNICTYHQAIADIFNPINTAASQLQGGESWSFKWVPSMKHLQYSVQLVIRDAWLGHGRSIGTIIVGGDPSPRFVSLAMIYLHDPWTIICGGAPRVATLFRIAVLWIRMLSDETAKEDQASGVSDILNLSLLAKWAWKILKSPDIPCSSQVMNAYYPKRRSSIRVKKCFAKTIQYLGRY